MKKILSFAAIAAVTVLSFTACEKNDDEKQTATVTFEGSYYTALIDAPQYGGVLLYGDSANLADYKWTDPTTQLHSELTKAWGGKYGYSEGGIAISNYICTDSIASYDKQLAVPASNGSSNFAVVYDNSTMSFADGKSHVVKSMKVSPTTYTLRNMQASCGKGYEFKVILTGVQADSTRKSVEIYLANGTDVVTSWKNYDLSSLGAVNTISFSFDGTDKGTYLNTPKYVAIDDIVVEL